MTADTPRLRLGIVAIVALSLFAALFARLWYLQVLSAPDYRLKAQANQERIVEEPAPRGRILDRNGTVLVDNRASNVVAIDRASPKLTNDDDIPKLLARLSPVLGVPVKELGDRLNSQQVSRYTPIPVAEDVGEDKMTHLLERADEFPGVVAKRVAVRTYPFGNLAAHVLGYVGEINDTELKQNPDYELGDQIGKAGVEAFYERDLRGTPGELKIEVDAQGKPIRVVTRTSPVQGNDLVLSIDADVQRSAEEALAQGLASTKGQPFEKRERLIADAGAVVVLDTTNGTVEALASYPTFDLPALADGITTAEAKSLFDEKQGTPFVDRAISGRYAPGSTWKLITADAALRTGLITPNFSLIDNGVYTIPGDCIKRGCVRHNAGSKAFGRVGVARALAVSSDVYFYTLGGNFWIKRGQFGSTPIQDVAAQYGFGELTGIPLAGEKAGQVLSLQKKEELYKEDPRLVDGPGWYTGDNVNLAIGQAAMLVTPIQIANAYATFANGGTRYVPNIALRVQRQDRTVVRTFDPRVSGRVELAPVMRNTIMSGLEGVVSDPDGTAYNAFRSFPLGQWGIAGKTGTAQAPPKQDTALFVGFGPMPSPKHVVAVVMEQSGFGASAAAPVARRVFGTISGLEAGGAAQFTPANGAGD